MAAIRADHFGSTSFGMIVGPLVAGILADRTGSYVVGFTVLAIMAALGSIFFLLAVRPTPPGAPQRRAPVPSATVTAPTS